MTVKSVLMRSATVIGIVLLAALVQGCGPATTTPTRLSVVHHDGVQLPGGANLTPDQKLDRAMSLSGQVGFLRGTTGLPTVNTVSDATTRGLEVVTDYPFRVESFAGTRNAPYAVGQMITLRVPGGMLNGLETRYENAPTVAPNSTYYVNVRDQGQVLGGSNAGVLVASDVSDVFQFVNGTVIGQGPFRGFTQDEATFRAHFTR